MVKALACVAKEADAFQAAIFDGSSRDQSHMFLKQFCICFISLGLVVQSRDGSARYLKKCFMNLNVASELKC